MNASHRFIALEIEQHWTYGNVILEHPLLGVFCVVQL